MPLTSKGIYYPGPEDVPQRRDLQDLAETTNTALIELSGLLWVSNSVVTTVSGIVVVPHSLGRIPVYGEVALTTEAFRAVVTARTITNVTVKVVNATTNVVYSGSISIMLLVA